MAEMVRLRIGEPRFTAVMRMVDGRYLVTCNECRAVIVGGEDQWAHLDWHKAEDTLTRWTEKAARSRCADEVHVDVRRVDHHCECGAWKLA